MMEKMTTPTVRSTACHEGRLYASSCTAIIPCMASATEYPEPHKAVCQPRTCKDEQEYGSVSICRANQSLTNSHPTMYESGFWYSRGANSLTQ